MLPQDNSTLRHRCWRALVAISATAITAGAFLPAAMSSVRTESTLAKAIAETDVVVIARLVAGSAKPTGTTAELKGGPPIATFEIVEVLKGAKLVAASKQIEVAYFDDKPVGTEFLIAGIKTPAIQWSQPLALSPRSHKYLTDLMKLPADEPQRLIYFMNYLGDKEELLAGDSRDEFNLASFSTLKAIREKMPHDELVKHVQDREVLSSHRRVCLKMLSVCGTAKDLPMLEQLLRSNDDRFRASLDATAVCYLRLRGENGLPLVEDLFLKKDYDGDDIYSIIVALRTLGDEKNGPIPLDRIASSMRKVLDHPRIADQVVMDLARWHDWSAIDRVVELFNSTDENVTSWVRVPAITYLRMCPLPKAKEHLAKLRRIDPEAARRSEALCPLEH